MKLDEFTEALNEALIQRGVPERIASLNVEKLTAHLNSDAYRAMDSYSSNEKLNLMADELSERLLRHLQIKDGATSGTPDKTDTDQNLESLNDAVNRAVESPEGGTGIGGTSDFDDSLRDSINVTGNPGDIELTASSEITEIIFDEDDDVIELSATPDRNTFASDNTVLSPSRRADSAEVIESRFDAPPEALTDESTESHYNEDNSSEENTAAFSLPSDDIGEYAPDAAMLTSMGLAGSTYEAEAIETRAQKGADAPALPPLPEIYENGEGKRKFRNAVICLSPIIAVATLAYFVAWGLVFAAEAALIAGLIATLVATVAAGTLASITGIIYGIVRLSARRGEGIFEIGLGIVIAGATLLAGILIYNAALRFMPWAIKKTAYLFRLCSRCIRIRIRQARGRFSEK